MVKLAAIDIGSNAIRFQISSVWLNSENPSLKRQEYIRFPLRLGDDVFEIGKIGPLLEGKFEKLMIAFKMLIDLYEVQAIRACATSAMRDSSNGKDIVAKIKKSLGLTIEIISGEEEAILTSKAIKPYIGEGNFAHIDVGGGSTEINLYHYRELIFSKSYEQGSVRNIHNNGRPMREMTEALSKWQSQLSGDWTSIGTGGNIRKLKELVYWNRNSKPMVAYKKLQKLQQVLESMTIEERKIAFQLNDDRADVIVPASRIYLTAMQALHSQYIIAPEVGLIDGIMVNLLENYKH